MDLGIGGTTVGEEIAVGGSATIYRGHQPAFGRAVAVKVMHVHFGPGTEVERRRFERERLVIGRVSDRPGVIPVYDSGFTDDGRPYLIMPLYEAGSLQDRLDREGAIAWPEAAEIMVRVARAVELAHADGVMHRDIKPANIMVGRDGTPVVGDFGIAQLLGSTTLFRSQTLKTTPAYAAPEVFADEVPSVASDVYSLGATLFALVNGAPAFVSVSGQMNVLALMRRVESDPVPDLRGQGVPPAVADVVERSMAKDPEVRHRSAAGWADDLERAVLAVTVGAGGPRHPGTGRPDARAAAEGIDPRAVLTPPAPPRSRAPRPADSTGGSGDDDAAAGRWSRRPPRRAWWFAGAGVAVVAVAAAVVAAAALDTGGSDGATPMSQPASADGSAPSSPEGSSEPWAIPDGAVVTVSGPRASADADVIEQVLTAYGDRTGVDVRYSRQGESDTPDIEMVRSRNAVVELVGDGAVASLPDEVVAGVRVAWPDGWLAAGTVDGDVYGVPTATILKSIVWYRPAAFSAAGYGVPGTWDELVALTHRMIDAGDTPWCVGIAAGPSTGWPFTDWVEELVLRLHGPAVYDDWLEHRIPSDDRRIQQAWTEVVELWDLPGAVHADGSIAETTPQAGAASLAAGDCMMVVLPSILASSFPTGTDLGGDSEDAVDVFYLPAGDPRERPVLAWVEQAVARRDAPEVWAVMAYLGSSEYADDRQRAHAARSDTTTTTGFLSRAQRDESALLPFDASLHAVLDAALSVRLDGSNSMPLAVGAEAFLPEGTAVVEGHRTVADATAAVEASWPG